MKVTILGCGTSFGVPRIGGDWGVCDPENPRNRRRRVSILVEDGPEQGPEEGQEQGPERDKTRLLVDTSPDLRAQLLDAGVRELDAVLYTHDHADHTHGIDDLRAVAYAMRRKIPVYSDQATFDVLSRRFEYIFAEKFGYPPICEPHIIDFPGGIAEAIAFGPIPVQPFVQAHGAISSIGYRFGDVAYSTDLNALSEAAFAALEGTRVWIVDALRYEPHPTHAHLDLTLEWIARVRPERAILTHMTGDMDYATLKRDLPAGVEPAYDGMVIEL